MSGRGGVKISKRTVDALCVKGKDAVFWDRDLPGFGVRVHATGRKVCVVQTRGPNGPKRVSLGRHGEMPAEQARKEAAAVIDRIKRGKDPVPPPPEPELTIAGLAERYLRAHVSVHCKARTARLYRGVLNNHILPELGDMPLGTVGREHVAALHYRLRDTPRMANEAVKVLSKMFGLAEAWSLVPPGTNPCQAVRKYRDNRRERFLTVEEYRRLGRVLTATEADGSVCPLPSRRSVP